MYGALIRLALALLAPPLLLVPLTGARPRCRSVTYYRSKNDLVMRRFMRQGDNGAQQMCVEFTIPFNSPVKNAALGDSAAR